MNIADEAIANARNRRDPLSSTRGHTKKLPEGGDLNREVRFLDDSALPPGIEQVSLGQDPTCTLQERLEEQETAVADGKRHSVAQKDPGLGVQHEGTQAKAQPHHA